GAQIAVECLCRQSGLGSLARHHEEIRRVTENIRPQRPHLACSHPALRVVRRQKTAETAGEDEDRRGLHAVGRRMMRRVLEETLVEIGDIAAPNEALGGDLLEGELSVRLREERMLGAAMTIIGVRTYCFH